MPTLNSFGFGRKTFKNFPELIPLAAIISTACIGCAGFMVYALATKPDVRLNKSSDLPPWERVGPKETRKLVTLTKYEPDEELLKLRKEIGSYKS